MFCPISIIKIGLKLQKVPKKGYLSTLDGAWPHILSPSPEIQMVTLVWEYVVFSMVKMCNIFNKKCNLFFIMRLFKEF